MGKVSIPKRRDSWLEKRGSRNLHNLDNPTDKKRVTRRDLLDVVHHDDRHQHTTFPVPKQDEGGTADGDHRRRILGDFTHLRVILLSATVGR